MYIPIYLLFENIIMRKKIFSHLLEVRWARGVHEPATPRPVDHVSDVVEIFNIRFVGIQNLQDKLKHEGWHHRRWCKEVLPTSFWDLRFFGEKNTIFSYWKLFCILVEQQKAEVSIFSDVTYLITRLS